MSDGADQADTSVQWADQADTSVQWADHVSTVPLRANDFDFLGHLNNSVHAQLMETGRWEWALANGVDLRTAPVAAVVVSLHIDYLTSIPWDPMGRVLVRTGLAESKRVTFTLRQTIETTDGVVAARGEVKLAPIDRVTQRLCRTGLGSLRAGGQALRP